MWTRDSAADIHAAVRALRGAIDETAADDPELPRRRALLGHAYLERFRADGTVADLHEADWTLGAAARAAADPELAAYAWWYRALASALLAQRTASHPRLQDAAAHYRRAAAQPGAGEVLERAAAAQWMRATRLERTAGPERALEEHRAVLSMLIAADAAGYSRRTSCARRSPDSRAPEQRRGPGPASNAGPGPLWRTTGQASKTSLTSCSCSAWWRLAEPTAGDEPCGREMRRRRSPCGTSAPTARSRWSIRLSAMNGHAPWFAGSSWAHRYFSAFGYLAISAWSSAPGSGYSRSRRMIAVSVMPRFCRSASRS